MRGARVVLVFLAAVLLAMVPLLLARAITIYLWEMP